LLADSRASFKIEGEKPLRGRLERWGRAVLQAGKNPVTLDEIVRLHVVLIEDTRFTKPACGRTAFSWASGITRAIRYRNSSARARRICCH
jgi:hypothetical protein